MSSRSRLFQICTLLMVGLFLLVGPVSAAGLLCRSDPTVILSNGVIMDFGVTISTLPWNVKEVHYELHVPVGVSALISIHTPTWIGTVESFTIYADQPANRYIVKSVVDTRFEDVKVTMDATLVSPLTDFHVGIYTISGLENQLLTILLNI